jgi:tetratricopeptide (TPR) repeat protein
MSSKPETHGRGALGRTAHALCLGAVLLAAVAPAAAQERAEEPQRGPGEVSQASAVERARAHFQKGVSYYAEGHLSAALIEFERAYQLQPTFLLLYNLGQVTYEQGHYAAAERHFSAYLREGGEQIDAERRAEVERDLERLRERVADVLLIASQPGARLFVDDLFVGRSPLARPIRVSAGRRRVRAESQGYAPVSRVVDVIGGEAMTVEVELGAPLETLYREPAEPSSSTSAALWTGIATGVLGLGAAGMAYWAHQDDQKYDDALGRATSRRELDSLADTTKTKALVADALLGAAIITGTITVILLITGSDKTELSSSRAAAIQIGPGSLRAEF